MAESIDREKVLVEKMTDVARQEKILAFDTTGSSASIAMIYGDICEERFSSQTLNHLTQLMPMLDSLLADAGRKLEDFDAFAVSAGPGSFTGIRIGIATVRALAQGLGGEMPVIKVPTLETFAFACGEPSIFVPIFDARRSQIYAGAYELMTDDSMTYIKTHLEGAAYDPEVFFADLDTILAGSARKLNYFGEGSSVFASARPDYQESSLCASALPQRSALWTARWALSFGSPEPYAQIEPIYMRPPEAERKRMEHKYC